MRVNSFLQAIVTALAFINVSVYAADAPSQLQLPPANSVSKIELMLTPERITTIRPLREEDMPNWGCTFVSGSLTEIDAILSILSKHVAPSGSRHNYLLRNAIFIHLENGKTSRILLSDAYNPSDKVLGTFINESETEHINTASSGKLLRELRDWARNVEDRKKFSETCLK